MTIPFYAPYFDKDDEEAVAERIRSAWVIGDGDKGKEFEKEFSDYIGVRHTLLTTSCTTALDLAIKALNLTSGEAIVPAYTFSSTALAPVLNGLTVKFCDVNLKDGNIDLDKLEKCITQKTKAIIPVDYAGRPCKIHEIMRIARKNDLYVILDAAQSCGSVISGQKVGQHADITCFSFHSTKNLVSGEGGALVTNNDEWVARACVIREKGTRRNTAEDNNKYGYYGYYEHTTIGNSYVQSDILAALALSQLRKLDWMNNKRTKIARRYLEALKDISRIKLPQDDKIVVSNWHIFGVGVPADKLFGIRVELSREGVMCETHYRPLSEHKFFKQFVDAEEGFPQANEFSKSWLRLPIYVGLSEENQDVIIRNIRKVFAKHLQ